MEKISPIDWIQALKRSKVYAEDYKKYSEEYKMQLPDLTQPIKNIPANVDAIYSIPYLEQTKKRDTVIILSDASKKLCQKYRLRFPIDPYTPFHDSELLYIRSPINYLMPREFVQKLKNTSTDGTIDLNLIESELASYQDGRLVIMLDLAFSRDQIKAEFDKILYDWSEKTSKRFSAIVIDKWEVYDLRQNNKKSFVKISMALKGSTGKPSEGGKDDAYLQEVKRAYNKARQIITAIENNAKPPLKVF